MCRCDGGVRGDRETEGTRASLRRVERAGAIGHPRRLSDHALPRRLRARGVARRGGRDRSQRREPAGVAVFRPRGSEVRRSLFRLVRRPGGLSRRADGGRARHGLDCERSAGELFLSGWSDSRSDRDSISRPARRLPRQPAGTSPSGAVGSPTRGSGRAPGQWSGDVGGTDPLGFDPCGERVVRRPDSARDAATVSRRKCAAGVDLPDRRSAANSPSSPPGDRLDWHDTGNGRVGSPGS